MLTNNISSTNYQTQQNFGALIKPGKKVTKYLNELFSNDAKIAKQYTDTFNKIKKQQAHNPHYDIKLGLETNDKTGKDCLSASIIDKTLKEKGKTGTIFYAKNTGSKFLSEKLAVIRFLEDINNACPMK